MKLALKIFGGLFTLLLLALIAANLFISTDMIFDRLAEQIRSQTGRELRVAGEKSLYFLPNPSLTLNDVTLTDPNATGTAVEVEVPRLEVTLSLADLIGAHINITHLLVSKPTVTLRPVAKKAELAPQPAAPESGAPAAKPLQTIKPLQPIKAQAAGAPSQFDIEIGDMRIENATVRMLDEKGALSTEVKRINAAIALPGLNQTLSAEGNLQVLKKTVDFGVKLTSPAALQAQQPADVNVALAGEAFNTQFQGKLAPNMTAKGRFKGTTSSFQDLIAWQPDGRAPSKPAVKAILTGDVAYTTVALIISDASFTLGQSNGRGQATVHLDKEPLHLRAAVAIETLDVTPFLPKGGAAKPATAKPAKKAQAKPATKTAASKNAASKSDGINVPDDWFSSPAAQQFPSNPSNEDPAAKMQPGAVAAKEPTPFEADLNINVRKTIVEKITIGPSTANLGFHKGILTAKLGSMKLYNGEGRGKLTIDSNGATPVFSGNLTLDRVAAGPLLKDAADLTMLSGTTKLVLKLNGKGATANQIKQSLTGNGSVVLSDGVIQGIDINRFVNTVGKGDINSIVTNLGQNGVPKLKGGQTKFSSLGGSFNIKNGIAKTDDTKLVSPNLKVDAKGTVNIPKSYIDMVATPRVTADKGTKAANLNNLTVPIRIRGPFSNPSYIPQVGKLLNDPKNATATVNKVGEVLQEKLKGNSGAEALGQFLGGVQIGGGNQKKKGN
ncbi:AsmA family protein [Methyloligella sp. 2.7D]|uniref:AsmA family protein n=1 Tax=unclassified Methyloligella TaxID=2625955 RepID=UPI00157CB6D8|nr:AsmA family protein [Methyloligella sp. GL2]QKP78595.1 AsmA family protein [Methyloligella sp. GL2]